MLKDTESKYIYTQNIVFSNLEIINFSKFCDHKRRLFNTVFY